VFVACHREMHAMGGQLVERAKRAGAVRADLEQRDLLWLVHGVTTGCGTGRRCADSTVERHTTRLGR